MILIYPFLTEEEQNRIATEIDKFSLDESIKKLFLRNVDTYKVLKDLRLENYAVEVLNLFENELNPPDPITHGFDLANIQKRAAKGETTPEDLKMLDLIISQYSAPKGLSERQFDVAIDALLGRVTLDNRSGLILYKNERTETKPFLEQARKIKANRSKKAETSKTKWTAQSPYIRMALKLYKLIEKDFQKKRMLSMNETGDRKYPAKFSLSACNAVAQIMNAKFHFNAVLHKQRFTGRKIYSHLQKSPAYRTK